MAMGRILGALALLTLAFAAPARADWQPPQVLERSTMWDTSLTVAPDGSAYVVGLPAGDPDDSADLFSAAPGGPFGAVRPVHPPGFYGALFAGADATGAVTALL